jgi:hypothetical protein
LIIYYYFSIIFYTFRNIDDIEDDDSDEPRSRKPITRSHVIDLSEGGGGGGGAIDKFFPKNNNNNTDNYNKNYRNNNNKKNNGDDGYDFDDTESSTLQKCPICEEKASPIDMNAHVDKVCRREERKKESEGGRGGSSYWY